MGIKVIKPRVLLFLGGERGTRGEEQQGAHNLGFEMQARRGFQRKLTWRWVGLMCFPRKSYELSVIGSMMLFALASSKHRGCGDFFT